MKSCTCATVMLSLLVAACGAPTASPPPAPPSAAPKRAPTREAMKPFELNGYTLAGAEYWPYLGESAEPRYPEEVLWGFYPKKGQVPPDETDPNADDATPAAIACAERAYERLRAFLAGNPTYLHDIVREGSGAGFTPLFYLWVNDYSRAADPYPHPVRAARLWYWKRKDPDPKRPAGYWKWGSTLTRAGQCTTPDPEQVRSYLRQALDAVRAGG